MYLLFWYFQQNKCFNIKKTCCTQHTKISMWLLFSCGPRATAQRSHMLPKTELPINVFTIKWGQVIIPIAHYSDSPLLRRPIIPTVHCSDSPFLRQPIIPSKMVKSSKIILKSVVFLLYLTED